MCELAYFWCLVIIPKKSCCIRICPRNDYVCANIDTVGWVIWPVKTRLRYDLYCVGGTLSLNQSIITTSQGYRLPWTDEIRGSLRYLGIYTAKSRQFGCSIDHAKKSFSRSAMQYLVKSAGLLLMKLPWSYWGQNAFLCWHMAWNAFHYQKSDLKSLGFAVTRFLMKLFRTSNTEIMAECQHYFGFSLPSKLVEMIIFIYHIMVETE